MEPKKVYSKSYFKINKKQIKNISDKIKPISYSKKGYTGKGVKIAVIDSGCPQHSDIKICGEQISFCDDNANVADNYGHSTMVSGIISANNDKSIIGIAPDAELLFAKVANDAGECSFNSIVAGVLWSIVKQVDIMVVALGTQYDYSVMHDAVKKARDNNICIFAAAGSDIGEEDLNFPARYSEAFSASVLTKGEKKNKKIMEKSDLYTSNKGMYTTYTNNKYVRAYGSSISTAYFAGHAALLIEQYRKTIPRNEMPALIYSKLIRELNGKKEKNKKSGKNKI